MAEIPVNEEDVVPLSRRLVHYNEYEEIRDNDAIEDIEMGGEEVKKGKSKTPSTGMIFVVYFS